MICIMTGGKTTFHAKSLYLNTRAQREINEEEYISAEWCLSQFRARCQKCNTSFNFEMKKGKLCSNFTCQRLDNSIAHHINNSTSFCVYCNVSAH